jgi:hypothetical protein
MFNDGGRYSSKIAAGAIGSTELAANVTPKFDRRFVSPSSTFTTSSALVDMTGATLTSNNLGETGNYLINFRTSFTMGAAGTGTFVINVNGVDVTGASVTVAGSSSLANASITCIAPNVAAGTVIKVRYLSSNASTLTVSGIQLTADGIPGSQVR